MNKSELAAAVAEKLGVSKSAAEQNVSAVFDAIQEAISAGDSVSLMGFGTLAVKDRAARTGRNPATGATVSIPAGKRITFSAGKALKDALK